jgi:hypothetical protein
LRMLTYFLNRGGKGLTAERRAELEKAKTPMKDRVPSRQGRGKPIIVHAGPKPARCERGGAGAPVVFRGAMPLP